MLSFDCLCAVSFHNVAHPHTQVDKCIYSLSLLIHRLPLLGNHRVATGEDSDDQKTGFDISEKKIPDLDISQPFTKTIICKEHTFMRRVKTGFETIQLDPLSYSFMRKHLEREMHQLSSTSKASIQKPNIQMDIQTLV